MPNNLLTPIVNDRTRSVNFFNGRLLTGEDLTAEQQANRDTEIASINNDLRQAISPQTMAQKRMDRLDQIAGTSPDMLAAYHSFTYGK